MSQKPNVIYFMPDQIIFQSTDRTDDEKLQRWANSIAESKGISLSFSKEVFDFNPAPSSSIRPLNVAEQNKKLADLGRSYRVPELKSVQSFSLISAKAENKRLPPFSTDPDVQQQALHELFDLIVNLDESRNDKAMAPPDNLKAVSPDWLMSSGSQPGATGGPGALPTPYQGQADLAKFRFPTNISAEEVSDEEVVVAILDTAPKLKEIDGVNKANVLTEIYKKWGPSSQIKHPLIATLLDDRRQGRLQNVIYDDEVDKPVANVVQDGNVQPGYIQPEGHEYEMSDHGLFVAGIIHSLAPTARLHLFQVLNRYGVGDVLSIMRALKIIEADTEAFPKDRLLINLSLTINFPLEPGHGRDDAMLNRILTYKSEAPESWFQRQIEPIASICSSLSAQGTKVIAAAGNNRKGSHRPQACYPAAFESVLGVGALSIDESASSGKKIKLASYSNRSDRPAWTGITTLGGEEGEGAGILGIYLEEFPPSRDNKRPATKSENGWGWWAGTSFAAPIITGMTAAVRASKPGVSTMEEAVLELFEAQQSKTVDNEDVLETEQNR